ncbi:MAG: protein TolQ [Gammaproteobacteria bacterium]|nr:protein TolQ [Gammaproteobacteria bacterium]
MHNTDMSILALITNASTLVQLVMLGLLIASIIVWTLIFYKWRSMKQMKQDAEVFERRFWSGVDLVDLYKSVSSQRNRTHGIESIFEAGFKEYAKLHNQAGMVPDAVLEGAQRAMRISLSKEVENLESGLAVFATVGSTSPYVGLFGTVWGIMNSFRALGQVQQASMSMVAPGIAEALIATAMGLFAAIPAVVAYNRYMYSVERLESRYEIFMEEFSNLLNRQVHAQQSKE